MSTIIYKKIDRFLDFFIKELSEGRVLLCWFYALAYLALIFYCVVTNLNSHSIAITVTGGITGSIISAWVLGKSYENVNTPKVQPSTDSVVESQSD